MTILGLTIFFAGALCADSNLFVAALLVGIGGIICEIGKRVDGEV